MSLKKITLGFFILILPIVCGADTLQKDETVLFFPSTATQQADGSWQAPIHHWVFEKEDNGIFRKMTQKAFSEVLESLGVSEDQAKSPITHQRLMWFLVDNQWRKSINIAIDGKLQKLKYSKANGHGITQIKLSKNHKAGSWASFKVEDPFLRDFNGKLQFIPEVGVSVISDIDDTVKISNVLDKKELIKNTFVNPYQVTKGFPNYYRYLKQEGAYFHYVSASPWQLYPSLKPFMEKNYPQGSYSLRNFRLKDSSLFKFLKPSSDYKIKAISKIIQRYPKHSYILIGDSGEHDPEVYAEIYKRFPDKIKAIKIRKVKNSDLNAKRFANTFSSVPNAVWRLVGY